jgi:hypothetical protein
MAIVVNADNSGKVYKVPNARDHLPATGGEAGC